MPTCFISHTWRDSQHNFALRLKDALRSQGIETWVDAEQICGGELIKGEMHTGIIKSDVFLFVLSPEALQSENCLLELNWAFEQRQDAGLQIIPLLRKDCCRIPASLQGIRYLDFRNDKDLDRALAELLPAVEFAAKVKRLCDELLADDPEDRIEAARALAQLRNRFTVPVLARRRSADYDPDVQYWLAVALGEIRGEEAVAALAAAMGEPDLRASQGVTDALLLLGQEALEVVLAAVESDDPIRRRTAARVLVDTREIDPRIKAALAKLKNDPDRRVRSIAQRAEE